MLDANLFCTYQPIQAVSNAGAGSGQQLTDQAVAGLSKALGRRQKREAKQAKKAESKATEASVRGEASAGGPVSPLAAKNPAKKASNANKGQKQKKAESGMFCWHHMIPGMSHFQ